MQLLKELCAISAPSGSEGKLREFIIKNAEGFCDEIKTDSLGNLIARKKGAGKRIMLSAHMDEVGFITIAIDKKDYVAFSEIGDVKLNTLTGNKVLFLNDKTGIVVEKVEKPIKPSDYRIEVLGCKGESLYMVNVGDVATFYPAFDYNNNFISSKALNSRMGCYVLLQLLKEIQTSKNDLYFVFTAQHQIGFRGAKIAAAQIDPHYSITIDSAVYNDFADIDSSVSIDMGPAVKIMDSSTICHPKIRKLLSEAAEEEGMQIQLEVSENFKSAGSAIQTAGAGVISGTVSIPLKYINTPNEVISFNDVKGSIRLLKRMCAKEI
ncbi:MAG: M42 family peptidase [Firmicutes bacterium]|nr:M42 family peptidase [Bacillota bacterium]